MTKAGVMEEDIEEYPLTGFDPSGEPMVRRTASGRLWLCVQFIPPTWVPDEEQTGRYGLGVWDDFDKRLASALGVAVVWEDREWFRIDQPREDTVQAIHRFLLAERARLDRTTAEAEKLEETLRNWLAGTTTLTEAEVEQKKLVCSIFRDGSTASLPGGPKGRRLISVARVFVPEGRRRGQPGVKRWSQRDRSPWSVIEKG
ncbi:MAG: hypothetical protein U0792_11380 [Gemmataceae bacterium]